MSYLIDRQAVIDLLKQMRKDGGMVPWEGKDVFARIRKLPTIQPEKAQLSQEGTTKDAISRQAALEKVRAMQTYKLFDDIILVDKATVQTELMMLPSLPTEPQWIPVNERLPEESGYYITSNEYGGVNEDFYHDGHFWNADKNAYEVTAWMLKPSPYQKGATP